MSIFVTIPSTLSPVATRTAGTNLKREKSASMGVSVLTIGKAGLHHARDGLGEEARGSSIPLSSATIWFSVIEPASLVPE